MADKLNQVAIRMIEQPPLLSKGYWFNAGNKAVNWALSKERLINWGFYDIATAYQSLHINY